MDRAQHSPGRDLLDSVRRCGVEVNYTYWNLPWLGLTPDFQYVFNPNGGGSNNDAAVFGGQILVNF